MDATQNLTKIDDGIDHAAIQRQTYVLTSQQQAWVDYKALGGVIYDADADTLRKMPVHELAEKLNISRETLYQWRNQIPGFWERVEQRRAELNGQEVLAQIHTKWKIKALKMDNWPLTEAWLRNFDKSYKLANSKTEEAADSLAELMNLARSRRAQSGQVIDGEVVRESSSTNT
jgi:hypothetical protein